MPVTIDRSWLNAQVDDDGSGTTGSILDKADFTAIHDAIDVALAAVGGTTPGITTDGTRVQQISFAATQSASADANTLDDYEEGSWTPVIGGSGGTSGQTYSLQLGRYIKNGKIVVASCHVALSAKGTITGNVQIQGLPFTSGSGGRAVSGQVRFVSLATNWIALQAWIDASAAVASLQGNAAAATSNATALTTTDITNTTDLMMTFMYEAAN